VVSQPTGPSEVVTNALSEAVGLMRAHRYDDAERRLGEARTIAASDDHELEKLDYYIATVLAYRGDLGRALRLVRAHANAANGRGDIESEVWMQSCAAWLRWAVGDLGGAVMENERIAAIAGDEADTVDRRAMVARQLWDRAFFLVEKAFLVPEAERVGALRSASDARDAYDTFVRGSEAHEEGRLLAGWFAWKSGDVPAAQRALSGLSPDDPRGLFIEAVVLEKTEDADTARTARARLQGTVNLLAAVLERKARVLEAPPPEAPVAPPAAPAPTPAEAPAAPADPGTPPASVSPPR
jgi:hypothetical protein